MLELNNTLPQIMGWDNLDGVLENTQVFGDSDSQYNRSLMLGVGGTDAPDKSVRSVEVDAYLYYIPKELLVKLKQYREKSTVPVSEETASIVYTVLYQMWSKKRKDRKYLILPYRIMYKYFEMLFTNRTTHRVFQFLINSKAITYRKMKTYKFDGYSDEYTEYANDYLLVIQLNESHDFFKAFRRDAQVCCLSYSFLKLMKTLCEINGKSKMNFIRLAFILQQLMYMSSDRAKQYKRKMTYKFWAKIMPWVSVRGFSTYIRFLEDVGLITRKMKKHFIKKEEVTKKNEFPYYVFTEVTYKIKPHEVIKKLYGCSIVEAFAKRVSVLYGWNVFGKIDNRKWYHSHMVVKNEFDLLRTLDLNKMFWGKRETDDYAQIRRNYMNLPYLVSHSESDEKALRPMAQAVLILPKFTLVRKVLEYYNNSADKEELAEHYEGTINSVFTRLWVDKEKFIKAFELVETEKRWIKADRQTELYYEYFVWKTDSQTSKKSNTKTDHIDYNTLPDDYREAFEEYDRKLRYQYKPDASYDEDYYDDYEYADADGYY